MVVGSRKRRIKSAAPAAASTAFSNAYEYLASLRFNHSQNSPYLTHRFHLSFHVYVCARSEREGERGKPKAKEEGGR